MHFGQGWPKMPLYKIFCNLNAGDHTKIMFRIRSTMFRIRSKSLISTLLGFAVKRCCAKPRCLNGKLQRRQRSVKSNRLMEKMDDVNKGSGVFFSLFEIFCDLSTNFRLLLAYKWGLKKFFLITFISQKKANSSGEVAKNFKERK